MRAALAFKLDGIDVVSIHETRRLEMSPRSDPDIGLGESGDQKARKGLG